ncbi:MAG: ribonuclease D [Rhodospirillaceae bacterium]
MSPTAFFSSGQPDIRFHEGDLPADVRFPHGVAVDTETMGLHLSRDRLCLVQLSGGDGVCHLVKVGGAFGYNAPNLVAVMADPACVKIMHYGRFDMASLKAWLGVDLTPVYCTKIASKLCRTNTSSHSLKSLCRDLLGVTLNKEEQSSDWGADSLTPEQQHYAASDVLYLHALKAHLDLLLAREGRSALAKSCHDFLATRVALDLTGWDDEDLFAH